MYVEQDASIVRQRDGLVKIEIRRRIDRQQLAHVTAAIADFEQAAESGHEDDPSVRAPGAAGRGTELLRQIGAP